MSETSEHFDTKSGSSPQIMTQQKTILIITVIQGLGWWVGHNASDWNNLRVRTLLFLKL